ncbi:hypothetical protein CPAR01_01610 [Colletotrichum paranaense]|uniref:Uncharacterized protein n=1 Tax=Colletotrichum paranaense TaxID=1914294 RepID=A0ABQ9T782_9PEZI|nr:uncharacterized protein CPAR01_01610 [Colletotrichum paranaense]KAK1547643.1 hypothetical protein CPAR01_01610 [Colletotrichum paranaense]
MIVQMIEWTQIPTSSPQACHGRRGHTTTVYWALGARLFKLWGQVTFMSRHPASDMLRIPEQTASRIKGTAEEGALGAWELRTEYQCSRKEGNGKEGRKQQLERLLLLPHVPRFHSTSSRRAMDAHAHAQGTQGTPTRPLQCCMMYSVPNGRHQNTPRGKVPPSLRTDIYAHAHVPSWNPRTRPVAPQFGPSLPFPNPRPLLFSSVTVSLPPSPPPTRLPIPAAVVFLSSSSAGDLRIATSNRLFPCPFVGSTDLQYCDCESSAFFTRLHHPLASDPAASNNPPPAPSFPTILATHLAFAYPLLGTGRTPRTELFISHREQFHTATIVFAYTVEHLLLQHLVPSTRQLSVAVFAQTLGVTAFIINHSILPANCRVESD